MSFFGAVHWLTRGLFLVVAIIPPCLLNVTQKIYSQVKVLIWSNLCIFEICMDAPHLCFLGLSLFLYPMFRGYFQHIKGLKTWHFSHWLGCFPCWNARDPAALLPAIQEGLNDCPPWNQQRVHPWQLMGLFRWISFWGLGLFSGDMLVSGSVLVLQNPLGKACCSLGQRVGSLISVTSHVLPSWWE